MDVRVATRRRLRPLGCASVLLSTLALALPAASAAAGSFTWSGSASGATWSAGGNWVGGVAPSDAADALTFPQLAQCAPPASAPGTCYAGVDDLGPLALGSLSVDPAGGYQLTPAAASDTIALGAGGLSAVTPPGYASVLPSFLEVPIELAAPQAWTVDGSSAGGDLTVEGGVTGTPSDSLAVTVSDFAYLKLKGAVDAGPVSIAGGTTSGGNTGAVFLLGGDLNGTSGEPVSVTDAGLVSKAPETVGPLSMSGSYLGIGSGLPSTGQLDVAGSVTMDSSSTFGAYVNAPGTTPYTDYSQLSATGNIDLGGASLALDAGGSDSSLDCPALHGGDVDTLIVTSGGTLSGTFAGVPDGSIVPFGTVCAGELSPTVSAEINYTTTSVTATILSAPVSTAAPTIGGTPQQGRTLSATAGSWAYAPTAYSYQWLRCRPGTGCTTITGATSPTYTLTASDVGYWISVGVTASNGIGSSAPADSAWSPDVLPAVPADSSLPSISGAALVGQQLVESHGSWSGNPTVYRYQWLDCDASGNACGAIAGATSQTYTLRGSDLGYTVRVQETAYDAAGPGPAATSAPTAAVRAAGSTAPGALPGGSSPGGKAGGTHSGTTSGRSGGHAAGSARLVRGKGRGLTAQVSVRCAGAAGARCSVTVVLAARHTRTLVGRRRITIASGETVTLRIALNANGRRLLARRRTLELVASIAHAVGAPAAKAISFDDS